MFATDGTELLDRDAHYGERPRCEIEERMIDMRRRRDAFEAEWLAVVAEYDRSQEWQASGYASAANGLRHLCRMNEGHATRDVATARKLRDRPAVAAALAGGEISSTHAQVIVDAYTPEREEQLAPLEAGLVDAARRLLPREVRNIVRYATDAIDGDGGGASDERADRLRRWHQSETLDGMLKIDALLAPEATKTWKTALDAAIEHERVEGDERSPAQLRADAATSIVRGALDRAELGNSRKARPHLTEVFDSRQLPGVTDEVVDLARAERHTHGRLSQATVDALFCDCDYTRVVTAGPSEILDVGRATRTVTAAQWKALIVRDRHCQRPGCNAPPERCEAHHQRHWEHGGPTDLANLLLLCWYHHRQHHRAQARARSQPQPPTTEPRLATIAAMPRAQNTSDPVP